MPNSGLAAPAFSISASAIGVALAFSLPQA